MGALIVGGVALCLVLYAVLFYLILKDAEEDRAKGPHHIQYEIREYPDWGVFHWKVWSADFPEISHSGETHVKETAKRHIRRSAREVRDEIVFGTMEDDEGEIWL